MKRLDECVPVEPLSDAAWNRIGRAIFEDGALPQAPVAKRRTTWVPAALVAAGVLQVAAAVALMYGRTAQPQGAALALESTRMATGAEVSETTFGDIGVRIEPTSALVLVRAADSGAVVVLERGAAYFTVAPRGERPAFVVQAGDARVAVVGTRFRVERAGATAKVQVSEGTVRVSRAGRDVLLHAGDRWPTDDSAAALVAPAIAPAPPMAASRATPADAHSESSSGASSRAGALRGDPSTGQLQRFERAASLEVAEPEQALRIYRGLAEQGGRWGANALYAMGRLEVARGQQAHAVRLLQRYLERYPRGANRSDVRALLDQLPEGGTR